MSMSKALSGRITMICALVVLCVGLAGGMISFLLMIGKLTPGTNVFRIDYFMTGKTVWLVPIELYMAIAALILLAVSNKTVWSMVWSTIIFTVPLGMIRGNTYNIFLWMMIASGITALCVSSAAFEGGIKVFLREIIDAVKKLLQQPASAWKTIAAILAIAFVLNYTHNEIIIKTSEEARDARLVEWYKNARNKTNKSEFIEVKIFTDYQCPACSQLVPGYLETVLAVGNGAVQVKLRDFPLDTACNDSSFFSLHPSACSAAYAARLADMENPDESRDFRLWLYANRSILNDDVIMRRLKEIGVDNPQDMFDDEIRQAVQADIEEAKTYGISGVPSVLINNVLLQGGLNPSKLELLIKSEIEESNNSNKIITRLIN